MRSNYRNIGDFIELVDIRNKGLQVTNLVGLSITKQFIESVANTVGTNMENYKIIHKNQFACSIMQVRRDKKMPLALYTDDAPAIISQAYPVFEITNEEELLPEYLMMWFTRSEFDRHACFLAVGGVRGSLEWDDFLEMEIPVPSIEKQREIIKKYNSIVNRIILNEQLNQKLEEIAQALYRNWFVDFEFPDINGQPYKSSGGKMMYNDEMDKEIPEGWTLDEFSKNIFFQEGPGLRLWQWRDDGMKVINVKNIQWNGSVDIDNSDRHISMEEFNSKYRHFAIDEGDVIIAGSGNTYGKTGKILKHHLPIMMNTSVIRFHSKNELLFPSSCLQVFLFSKQMKEQIESAITGSAQPNFGPSHLKEMKVLYSSKKHMFDFDMLAKPILNKIDINNLFNNKLKKIEEILLAKMSKVKFPKTEQVL